MIAQLEEMLPEWAAFYPEQEFMCMLAEALDYIAASADPEARLQLHDAHRAPPSVQRRDSVAGRLWRPLAVCYGSDCAHRARFCFTCPMPAHGSLRRRLSFAGTSLIVNPSARLSFDRSLHAIGSATGAPGLARSE